MKTFTPATVTFNSTAISFSVYAAQIRRVAQHAGSQVGEATVCWPNKYAAAQSCNYGDRAYIVVNNAVVFRGCIASAPSMIDSDDDLVECRLFDDKWLLARNIIGQIGTGSQTGGAGFQHVGYDIVFNRNGRPDKDPNSLDFSLASNAVYWTYSTILQFLFKFYVDSDVAALNINKLGTAYDKKSTNINLVGQTAVQAIDTIVEMAGESWGLVPSQSCSNFVPVRPKGHGAVQNIYACSPKGGVSAEAATSYYASSIDVTPTIDNARDRYQAISAPIVIESVHSNVATGSLVGTEPLLTRDTAYSHPEFGARYKVDVTKYAAWGLGGALPAGGRPKRWLNRLVTRLNASGSAYVTAAQIAADYNLIDLPRAEIPVWISPTGSAGSARLVVSGYRIDCDFGLIDFKSKLTVLNTGGGKETSELTISNWANAQVWMTVPTVLETVDYKQSAETTSYLPKKFTQAIVKSELIPEQRFRSWLPDLSTGDKTELAATLEKYVDVSAKLTEVLDAAATRAQKVESHIDLAFEFFPTFNIGDLVRIIGRSLGQSGNEVIISVEYDVHESYTTSISATDVVAGAGENKDAKRKRAIAGKPIMPFQNLKRAKKHGVPKGFENLT